jgi:hypothetical protein
MKSNKSKKTLVIRGLAVFVLIACALFFLNDRKQVFLRECTRLLEGALRRGTDLNVRIGHMEGHWLGLVVFKQVEVSAPWLELPDAEIFKAKEIQFRYRFLDFLSKTLYSKVEIVVDRPTVRWRPGIHLKKPSFPFFGWMRQWALSQKTHFVVRVKDLTLILEDSPVQFEGVDLFFENHAFKIDIPISHFPVAEFDFSSLIHIHGQFQSSLMGQPDVFTGQIRTEGTVVNWAPFPEESSFDFSFSEEKFKITSSNFFGGIACVGEVDLANDYQIEFSLKAKNYPLSFLEPFLKKEPGFSLQGKLDLDSRFYGNPLSPQVEGHFYLEGGWVARGGFKAMDIHVTGFYPTLRLEDSRLFLEDGTAVRFSDAALDVKDLFRFDTYQRLVAEAGKDRVMSEVLMQKILGDQLIPQGSLKLEFKENEEFVGVERRMKF